MTKCACDAASQNASASTDATSVVLPPTCATATTTRVRVTEPHFSEMELAIMEKVFCGRRRHSERVGRDSQEIAEQRAPSLGVIEGERRRHDPRNRAGDSARGAVMGSGPMSGLVLTRRVGERIVIDGDIFVEVAAIQGGKVRLRIVAPDDVEIDREEIAERKAKERQNAHG